MSDGFWAVFGCGALFGMLMSVLIMGLVRCKDESDDIDLDMRLYVPSRDRDRSRNQRNCKQLDAEKEILRHAEKLGVKIGE